MPTAIADDASLAQRIGVRLRTLRTARSLTLSELSKQSGVSVSYLSAVEKGVNLPSLQTLARLTESLGVSIPSVLADEGRPHVLVASVPIEPGTVHTSHPQLQLTTAVVRAEPSAPVPAPMPLDGNDVFLYVISGEVAVMFGNRTYELGPGDAVDAHLPKSVLYHAVTTAVLVWSSCPARVD